MAPLVISSCFRSLFVATLVVDGASLAHVHSGLRRSLVRPVLESNHRVTGLQLFVREFPHILVALAGPVTVGATVARFCLRLKDHTERRDVTDIYIALFNHVTTLLCNCYVES